MSDRFFIDCEFDGHGGPLLSIAIVSEHPDGISAHIKVSDAPVPRDHWVTENILPILDRHDADLIWDVRLNDVGDCLRHALEHAERPTIIADSPVDISRFCQAISTGADGGWASADYPMMTFEVHNVDCWPNDLVGAVQHNAWWDAIALRHKLAKWEGNAL